MYTHHDDITSISTHPYTACGSVSCDGVKEYSCIVSYVCVCMEHEYVCVKIKCTHTHTHTQTHTQTHTHTDTHTHTHTHTHAHTQICTAMYTHITHMVLIISNIALASNFLNALCPYIINCDHSIALASDT